MQSHGRFVLPALLLLLSCGVTGCLFLPSKGTLVYVDHRTGDWWSGEAVLMDVSADQTQCRIAARDSALVVEKKWVPCKYVHPRTPQPN